MQTRSRKRRLSIEIPSSDPSSFPLVRPNGKVSKRIPKELHDKIVAVDRSLDDMTVLIDTEKF